MTPAPQPPPITGASAELLVQLFPLVLLLYAVSIVLSAEVQTVRETSSFHQWRREPHTAFALVLASLMYGLWTFAAAPGWLSIGEPVLTYLVDHIRGGQPVLLNASGALIFAVVFRWASSLRNLNRGFWPPTWWLPRQPSSADTDERER